MGLIERLSADLTSLLVTADNVDPDAHEFEESCTDGWDESPEDICSYCGQFRFRHDDDPDMFGTFWD